MVTFSIDFSDNSAYNKYQEESLLICCLYMGVIGMAVFSRPVNHAFVVAESKTEAFLKNDTKPAYKKSMERFRRHGGTKNVEIVLHFGEK